MRALVALLLLVGIGIGISCVVPYVELVDKVCPCTDGYTCVANKCVRSSSADASGTAGLDAATCASSFCSANAFFTCTAGVPGPGLGCDAGLTCDPNGGCLENCAGNGTCSPGLACDRSQMICVKSPACASPADCQSAQCEGGACIPDPPGVVQAVYNSGTVAAALSCYGLDAGVADTGTRTVTLRGLVLSANGEPTGRSIGSQLKLYRAADFIVSDTPAPLATSSVFDGGVSGTGDAGPAPAGTYTLDNVPVNEDLVISVSGGTGLMPTHQFVTVAIDAASTVDFQLVAYDQDLWDAVAKSANITPGATRAGVVGQVQDCSPQPRRILGATVALDTPSHVFYSDPMYFVVDPGATVTSRTGRYFFFDVPAMPINVVTALRTSATEVVYLDHRARTLPASITVVTLRPPVKNP